MARESIILLLPPARRTLLLFPAVSAVPDHISPSATWSWPFEPARDCASYFSPYLLSLALSPSLPCFSTFLFTSPLRFIATSSLCKSYVALTGINFLRWNYFAEPDGIILTLVPHKTFNSVSYILHIHVPPSSFCALRKTLNGEKNRALADESFRFLRE